MHYHLLSSWLMVDGSKCVSELNHPTLVSEITFFLLPSTSLPPNFGAVLYYSVPPFQVNRIPFFRHLLIKKKEVYTKFLTKISLELGNRRIFNS